MAASIAGVFWQPARLNHECCGRCLPYRDDGATLDDLREAVSTLEDLERTARRVLGDAHPLTTGIREDFCDALAALSARETPSPAGNA